MIPTDGNGWDSWKQYVLKALERIESAFSNHCQRQEEFQQEVMKSIGSLNVRSSIFGAVGGVMTTAILIGIYLFAKR